MDKDVVGSELTREDMDKLWSTEELLGGDKREILFFHHRLIHFTFKSLLRLTRKEITHRKIKRVRTPPTPMWPVYLGSYTRDHGVTKEKIRGLNQ